MRDRLVAHRGNAAKFHENSLDAIVSAVSLGLSYVEIDVQMSSDGVPVLIHDGDLRRLYRMDRSVSETECAALESLGIARLSKAIDVMGDAITPFVEIKADGIRRFGREVVVDRVCAELHKRSIVISFDLEALPLARDKGFWVGLVMRDLSAASVRECAELQPEYVFCDQKHIHSRVWDWSIWVAYEIANKAMAERVTGYGVRLLETMNPESFL